MSRLLSLLLVFSFVAASAEGQKFAFEGTMKVEFGAFKGAEIPFRAEYLGPVKRAPVVSLKPPWLRFPARGKPRIGSHDKFGAGPDSTVLYSNDNGDGTYFTSNEEFPCTSSLDDARFIEAANGAPWKTLTVGISAATTDTFLVRWKIYMQFVAGRGAHVTAFEPDPPAGNRDFGGYFSVPIEGNYKVTFNIASVGCFITGNQAYFAQQFREPQVPEYGEGPFDFRIQTIFSGGGATTGFSDDLFYFDWDPTNGIYDELEIDNFGGQGNDANFLLTVTGGGQVETALPTSFSVWGVHTGGNLGSLWNSDNNRVSINGVPPLGATLPAVSLTVEGGISPGQIVGLGFEFEGHCTSAVPQRIEFWNYAQNRWDMMDERGATQSDSVVQVVAPNNPERYVSSQSRVKARVSWYEVPGLPLPFTARADRTIWQVNRP